MSQDSESGPPSLLDVIERLESVAFVPSKQRQTDASQLAKDIAARAYESGISSIALERVVKILTTSNHLDQGTITTLIKNLYPAERVASNLVTRVVCCLGPSKGKPSPATQAQLLRWLILVYDFLEDRSQLSKLYAVLFNYLDMISLRKSLCHILSLITRRKHVKPFRIQALMELVVSAGGDERELMTLLKVFKNYCSDVIIGDLKVSGRKGLFFKHPDPEWTTHLKALHDTNMERLQDSHPSTFQVVHRGLVKRSKMEVIVPDVQTSRVSHTHTSLEELRSIDHFIEKIDRIELPNQMVSTMGDNIAQKYLFLVQPEAASRRLDDWLRNFLEDQLEYVEDNDDDNNDTLGYILSLCVGYVQYTKEVPTAIVSFLNSYFRLWNGTDHRDQIYNLLEYIDIQDYDSVRGALFTSLESAVLATGGSSQASLLGFYCSLLRQWGVKLRARPFTLEESKPLRRLVSHGETLALSVLECRFAPQDNSNSLEEPESATLSVIEFLCTLGELFSHASSNGNVRLTIPLAPTIYSLVFTPANSIISIVCSVLAKYKSAFETSLASKKLQPSNSTESLYPPDAVGQFNGYIMDICNLLWRNRGLNSEDPNALGCLMPVSTTRAFTQYIQEIHNASRDRKREAVFTYTISSMFSLSHHVALCNMSAACFADIEEENNITEDQPKLKKPVTQKALSALEKEGGFKMTWQEYRVRMLDWLEATGSVGIGDLMRSTMKALRKE